jgi:hypothetical protein
MSTLKDRIQALEKLGHFFRNFTAQEALYAPLFEAIEAAKQQNGWFQKEACLQAIYAWGEALRPESIAQWIVGYSIEENKSPKTIALILAGNIPMVGWHDLICVWISGNKALVKCATKDRILIPFLVGLDPFFQSMTSFSEDRLVDFDAVIATGSNNAARYFDYYFSKYPHIIRRNKNGIAVLDGSESKEDLEGLGRDILQYYGLGCRNVSKLYLPKGYDLNLIFGGLYPHRDVIRMDKYANNYDYNKAVFLMSEFDFLENGFFILRENNAIASPIATAHYEYYEEVKTLRKYLEEKQEEIQCVVTHTNVAGGVSFGAAQRPALWDYADGVDTLSFLLSL